MVPVFLLTGFLGSGKTTLLNRMLDARPQSDGKLAIIVNELGAVGIDGDLLPAGMTQQVELPGGCICCALNEDLEKTLGELLDSAPEIESIVIETTGIAEPLPISWTLATEPLDNRVRLAAVITVVDPIEHERHRPMSPSVDTQVEYADLLVLSKLDVCDSSDVDAVVAGLRQRNQVAPIIAEPPERTAEALWTALADPRFESQDRPGASGHHHVHQSAQEFDTVAVDIKDTLDFEELTSQLEDLPATYIRIKGIATVIDESTGSEQPLRVAFHRVGARVSAEPVATNAPARVVAIGPGVEVTRLAACVQAAVVR